MAMRTAIACFFVAIVVQVWAGEVLDEAHLVDIPLLEATAPGVLPLLMQAKSLYYIMCVTQGGLLSTAAVAAKAAQAAANAYVNLPALSRQAGKKAPDQTPPPPRCPAPSPTPCQLFLTQLRASHRAGIRQGNN